MARHSAIGEMMQRQLHSVPMQLAQAIQLLHLVGNRYGIASDFRVIPESDLCSEYLMQSFYTDLLVVGHPDTPCAPVAWSFDHTLRHGGVPLLVIPPNWQESAIGRRAVVAWDGSHQARKAVMAALPL